MAAAERSDEPGSPHVSNWVMYHPCDQHEPSFARTFHITTTPLCRKRERESPSHVVPILDFAVNTVLTFMFSVAGTVPDMVVACPSLRTLLSFTAPSTGPTCGPSRSSHGAIAPSSLARVAAPLQGVSVREGHRALRPTSRPRAVLRCPRGISRT